MSTETENQEQGHRVELDLSPEGQRCRVVVDGVDVSNHVHTAVIRATVGEPTEVLLIGYDADERGHPVVHGGELVQLATAVAAEEVSVSGATHALDGEPALDRLKELAARKAETR